MKIENVLQRLNLLGCNHSSIASRRIMVKIEHQIFLYSHVYLLQDIKLMGYLQCEPL